MKIISICEALDKKLTRYFTGNICKHGHVAERLLSNRTCIECLNIKKQIRGQIPKVKEKDLARLYAADTPAKHLARTRKRQAAKIQRLPKWLTADDIEHMQALYSVAAMIQRESGVEYHNEGRCLENATILEKEIEEIDVNLNRTCSVVGFNFNSGDHLSSLLYGGVLNFPVKQVIGVYKTGARKGEDKEGWVDYYHTFPQLVAPLKGSELKKEGFFSTDEQTLKSLKCNKEAKKVVDFILTRSTLEKRRGTYFAGFPKLREEHGWQVNYLHGQLNQCVARTGRLSSSRPNLQNIDGQIKDLFYSRYY